MSFLTLYTRLLIDEDPKNIKCLKKEPLSVVQLDSIQLQPQRNEIRN